MPKYKYNSPKKKENWVSRLKKNIAALKGPGHSPAGKRYIKSQKAKGMKFKKGKVVKTMATKGIEARLRAAGLTEAEIKKLRGR